MSFIEYKFNDKYLNGFKTLNKIRLPKSSVVLGRILKSAFLIVLLILIFTPWVQTSKGIGKVTSFHPNDRLQNINAPVDGRIKKWYVRDGSKVKNGEKIVEIEDNDPKLIERLQTQKDAATRKYEAAKIAMETAEINYKRQGNLFNKGLASRVDFEKAKIKFKNLKSKEAEAQSNMNKAEVELSRQVTQLITAPRDGTISHINAGDTATFVKEGDIIATFTPTDVEPAVELFVSGLDVPLMHEGRKVRLQFEGWPIVQFSGWPSVAIGTFGGVIKFVDPSVSPNGKFRVLVVEDPKDRWPNQNFLRFGAKANGWVLLNTVSLGYEVWRQLNNFPVDNEKLTMENLRNNTTKNNIP
jgi:RND family efflux transporter MFP subunit